MPVVHAAFLGRVLGSERSACASTRARARLPLRQPCISAAFCATVVSLISGVEVRHRSLTGRSRRPPSYPMDNDPGRGIANWPLPRLMPNEQRCCGSWWRTRSATRYARYTTIARWWRRRQPIPPEVLEVKCYFQIVTPKSLVLGPVNWVATCPLP